MIKKTLLLFTVFAAVTSSGLEKPVLGAEVNARLTITRTAVTAQNKKKDSSDQSKKTGDNDTSSSEKKKVENIEKVLDYGVHDERKQAMNKILSIKDKALKKRCANKLIDLVKDEADMEVLVKAITVLGELEAKEAVPALSDKISHPSEDVRTAAVYAIKRLDGRSARGELISALKKQDLSKDSNYTEALIRTLGDFKATEIKDFAVKALEDTGTARSVRELLVLFLGSLSSNDVKDILLKLYKDEEEDLTIRSYAVNSLAKLKVHEATEDIREILTVIESYPFKKRKRYYNLYMYSVAAMARLGDKGAIPKLINALRSNNPQVRLKAIELIKDFKEKRTIDILKYKMEYDQSSKVRKAAKKALKDMGVDVKDKDE